MEISELKHVIEAALFAAGRPVSLDELRGLFGIGDKAPPKGDIRKAIAQLQQDCEGRGLEIAEVASGYRAQVRASMSPWLAKLWEIRPPRYSRALMETLAIIAYRQPVTRGDVEDVRGVSVTPNIIRTLLERGWVSVVGHRDVPGKPEMFGTTRDFLDYFGLKTLDELPELDELKDLDAFGVQLELPDQEGGATDQSESSTDAPEVASLEAARDRQSDEYDPGIASDEDPDDTEEPRSATVVPLKAR